MVFILQEDNVSTKSNSVASRGSTDSHQSEPGASGSRATETELIKTVVRKLEVSVELYVVGVVHKISLNESL